MMRNIQIEEQMHYWKKQELKWIVYQSMFNWKGFFMTMTIYFLLVMC